MAKQRISWKLHFIELVVVIIGISIAFALEGWSERKRENKLEVAYLQSLRSDLISDSVEIKAAMDSSQAIIQMVSQTFGFIYSNAKVEAFKRNNITSAYTPPYFYPKNDTYLSLVNSGNINLLKDFELKSELAELYEVNYDKLERLNGVLRSLIDRLIYPYMIENIEFSAFRDGIENSEPLKANKVRNMLGSYMNFLTTRNRAYELILDECDSLIRLVDEQLYKH